MNVRTGEIAADVAWARPASIPVALILGYNGAARASLDEIRGWGRPFLMGFESATTRAYAGGDAGEADSAFSCGSFDEVSYPRDRGSWVCAADASSTDGAFVPNIDDYGFRYALRQIAGGRSGPILAYGNPIAVEAMCSGIRRAGLAAIRWGVGTWGYGEGGSANQPPDRAEAELLQSGNTPGPADGTDHNWLYAPVAVFRALGGPDAPAPVPLTIGDEDVTYKETRADGSVAYWKLGVGDFFEVPEKVALGEALNHHGDPVPIETFERIALGKAAKAQADAYFSTQEQTVELSDADVAKIVAAITAQAPESPAYEVHGVATPKS